MVVGSVGELVVGVVASESVQALGVRCRRGR